MPPKRTKIFFDGGCRPNPGPIEIAVVVRGRAFVFEGLPMGDNSEAEWQALFHALDCARDMGLSDVVLVGDAREVIRKASAILADPEGGLAKGARAGELLERARGVAPVRLRWSPRAQNLAGIALAARHPR